MLARKPKATCFAHALPFRSSRKHLLLFAILPLCVCGCKKHEPAEYLYRFQFPDKDAPEQAVLMLGDRELGTVFRARKVGSQADRERGHVSFFLPREILVSAHQDEFTIRITSPCAVSSHRVKITDGAPIDPRHPDSWRWGSAYEQECRAQYTDRFRPEIDVPITIEGYTQSSDSGSLVWLDRHGEKDRTVTIGKFVAPRGENSFLIPGLDCAREHDVAVDGQVIGQFATDESAEAYLVSTRPGFCYRLRTVTYLSLESQRAGADLGAGPPRVFRGGKVAYPLPTAKIRWFLQDAANRSSIEGTAVELTRVACE